ncbi:MAG: T9SS type A sorting domain-containing protein [Bacteroidetes bacterium]|nr:T9SS type A sorting domain-containing protein [Bacteroidota bacterium]
MHKALLATFMAFCQLTFNLTNAQTTFTWNGSSSNAWNTNTNWTPNGIPTSTDNVIIVTGSNACALASNTSVNNFTLTSGTLNIGTFTFTTNGNALFTSGTINGSGLIDCEGSSTTFGNTSTGPVVNTSVIINALTVKIQRTRFNNSITITKLSAGTSVDSWRGGNTFNGNFTLNNASADPTDPVGDIYLGSNPNDPIDVFNARATFSVTGCARIRIPQDGSITFNGVTSFYSNGYGTNHDRIQPARQGTATVTFNDSTYFYCNSSTTDMQIAYDPNTRAIFNGAVVATHYGSSAAAFMFGNDGKVTFNNNLTLNCLGSGAITITNGAGTSTLTAGKTINIGSTGFSSGRLDIENFTQLGTTPQSFTLTGTAVLAIGASGKPSVFNANVNYVAPRIILLASTFNGVSVFTKTGGTADDCGGNTFNNTVTLNNSGTSEFRFSSSISADIFTTPLDINNTGTGSIRLSRTYATTYPENITVSNTTGGGIFFGANGGTSILGNTKTITVGAGGYANGYLYLYKFSQNSATAQNINLSGAATVLRMGDQANITSGCSFPGDFTASAKGIELTGNSFGGITIFNQSGPTTTRTWGGNNFTGDHTINLSGAAGIQCSQLFAADSYSSTVNLNLTSSGGVTLARTYNTSFPENITMTGTSTGGIAFGFSGGSSTLANGKTISIGGTGFTGSFLYLYKFNQIGNTPQSLTLTGTAAEIQIGAAASPSTYGCTFGGNLNVTSPGFVVVGNTFNGTVGFLKTGTSNDDSNGNNTFNAVTSFSTTGASGRWRLGTITDDFNDNVSFIQGAAGTIAPSYNAVSTFDGDITVSAPSGSAITFAGGASGRVTLDGNKVQSINKLSGNNPNFTRLTLNKTGNSVTLNTRINIISDMALTSGVINTTSSNILNMNDAATTTIGNSTSYINGPMNYDMALNGSRTLNFPIGKAADWRPAVLAAKHNAATSYTYKAELTNADAQALGYVRPATIVKNTSTSPTNWFDIGGTGATAGAGSVSSTSSPTAFNSFSRFTLANKIGGTNPLPIELLSFTALPVDKTVSLDWATASEKNNSHYEVERSADGKNFEYVTSVNAYGNGNSLSKQTYNAIDKHPYNGISYYRLKQVDKNGSFTYTQVVAVEFNSESFINIFPNPASDVLKVKASDNYSNATIKIISSIGVEVIANAQLMSYNGTINVSHLAAGIYYVVIENAGVTENIKISIQ